MNKKLVLWFMFTLTVFWLHAQEAMLQGTVRDDATGEGLPFASLIYKGTSLGTSTDTNGRFSLVVPNEKKILQISYLGYTTQEILIHPNQSRELDIRLKPDGIALQEVTIKPGKEKYSKKDNPAVRFVKKMIDLRDSNVPENKDYFQYDQYEKILLGLNEYKQKTKRNGKKGKFEFLNEFVDTLENGTTILPILEKEKIATVLYRKEPKSEKRIVRGQRSAGMDEMLSQDGVQQLLDEVFKDVKIGRAHV